MNADRVYIDALTESLNLKEMVLQELLQLTKEQERILAEGAKFSEERFQATLDRKEKLLKDLEQLDKGFESVYEKVRALIQKSGTEYKQDIQKLQNKIKSIMDDSVRLQALEKNNKERMTHILAQQKDGIKQNRMSNVTAATYYKNMANQHHTGQSYFLDKKK